LGRLGFNLRSGDNMGGLATQFSSHLDAVQGNYLLQVEPPRGGKKRVETYGSLLDVVARADELIRAGYNIGIWSPVSLEKH
jgi:hypothetical protein